MKIKHIVSETDWSDVIGGGLNLASDAYGAYGAYRTSRIPLVKDDTGIGYSQTQDGSWYAVDGPNKGKKVSPEKEKEIIALLARKTSNQIPNERTLRDIRSKQRTLRDIRSKQRTLRDIRSKRKAGQSIATSTQGIGNLSNVEKNIAVNTMTNRAKSRSSYGRKVAQQTPAATGQPAQAVQRPTQQTVKIGGQTLYPYNPSHAKIIAQENQQHAIPKAAPAPTQKPKYKPDGRGGFTRISERADFSAMLLRKLNSNDLL